MGPNTSFLRVKLAVGGILSLLWCHARGGLYSDRVSQVFFSVSL